MSKTPKKRAKQNYVNNADFYDALVKFKADRTHAAENGLEEPRIPEYIGKCIYLIATKLSNAGNFCNYSFKDEMISDGIEDCILRIKSFDPDKSTNPFAYFTQTCYFASVRRIKKEKKQKTIKSEMIKNSGALEYFQNGNNANSGDDGIHESSYLQFLMENIDIVPTDAEKDQAAKPIFKKTTKAHQAKLKALAAEQEGQKTIDKFNGLSDAEYEAEESLESIDEYYSDIEE